MSSSFMLGTCYAFLGWSVGSIVGNALIDRFEFDFWFYLAMLPVWLYNIRLWSKIRKEEQEIAEMDEYIEDLRKQLKEIRERSEM